MSYMVEEAYPVYDERQRTARKRHVCAACREAILPGHQYISLGMLWDGQWSRLKRCARCQAIHEHLRSLDRDTWPIETLDCGMSYEDEWGECPDEIAALAFALPGDFIGAT